ncbi:hypothetical protein Pelo_10194 [Pelomyxa schiedti]|nr:hypothetical protein Pelo_10194 [Pelomyxa schiedti]
MVSRLLSNVFFGTAVDVPPKPAVDEQLRAALRQCVARFTQLYVDTAPERSEAAEFDDGDGEDEDYCPAKGTASRAKVRASEAESDPSDGHCGTECGDDEDDEEDKATAVGECFLLEYSMLHGMSHWLRVATYGLFILRTVYPHHPSGCSTASVDGCDLELSALEECVMYSAFFHDYETDDPGHAERGANVWRIYAKRKHLDRRIISIVSQAILFHEQHLPHVDPAANVVTIALCNADRVDRVRFGGLPDVDKMYPDYNAWNILMTVADDFTNVVFKYMQGVRGKNSW